MAESTRYIEPSPEPPGRAFVPKGRHGPEKQEFFVGDEVFLRTKTNRGTLRLKVETTTSNNGRWYLKLSEGGTMYEDGAWVSQKKVNLAKRASTNP